MQNQSIYPIDFLTYRVRVWDSCRSEGIQTFPKVLGNFLAAPVPWALLSSRIFSALEKYPSSCF